MRRKAVVFGVIWVTSSVFPLGCGQEAPRTPQTDAPVEAPPPDRFVALAEPLAGWQGLPNGRRAGAVTFAGQPTQAALERFAAEGGTMVIDLRTHQGGDNASFDEPAAVERLGMDYLHIPMSGDSLTREDVGRFAQSMEAVAGPVLLHCGSANRAGGFWGAYLALHKGWDTEAAIEAGRAAGMQSESVEASARRVIGG